MSEPLCDVGVIGLGVMGGGLARNLAGHGQRVAIHSRSLESARRLAAEHPEAAFRVCGAVEELVRALARPRLLLLLVPAGRAVDDVLAALAPQLERDDVVVDAGNSHYADTERRCTQAQGQAWRFVGMGVSGGAEGALRGPSLMPGGDERAWSRLRPVGAAIAAASDRGPCIAWCGRGAAGHFVKMVHNGIEYGDLQLIAECALLLRRGLGLSPDAIARTFEEWNAAELESFLLGNAARIFRVPDPENSGALLLDAVLDRAGQKGTGRWTVEAALGLGVAVPTIAVSVDARVLSADPSSRVRAEALFAVGGSALLEGVESNRVRSALYAARIATYAQGFALLAAAEREKGYGTKLGDVARIWRGGCIIRARLLDVLMDLLPSESAEHLVLADPLRDAVSDRLPAWRTVVASALRAGLPVPALAASLTWLDTLSTARGSADLIQAQRDSFGAHGYERRDRPGVLVHSDWSS